MSFKQYDDTYYSTYDDCDMVLADLPDEAQDAISSFDGCKKVRSCSGVSCPILLQCMSCQHSCT